MAKRIPMLQRNTIWLVAPLVAGLVLCGCSDKKKIAAQQGTGISTEPDKVLYERAQADIKRNRFEEGRLSLQTLINTYPDSEYLAKAKLSMADSFFKQGGAGELTQAIAQYQDFITFFPFLDEAAYAQMQIGMAHYRRMEKPDRDRDEAIEAEGALQTFIQKYPSSPLHAQAEQRLREVQEVLAEGDFRVAYFYYIRKTDRASVTRLYELTNRYPLYSQADRANWMLASVYERTEHNDIAGQFYSRIVKDYPLSPFAAQAKAKLEKFGVPVPQPDPTAMARMQKEQQIPRQRGGMLSVPKGMLRSAPDIRMAARAGTPTMAPRGAASGDTMVPGGSLTVGGRAGGATTGSSGSSAYVETVTPGSAPPAAAGTAATGAATATDTSAAGGSSDSSAASTSDSTTPAADPAAAATSSTGTSTPASTESTSKKKKGLKKLVPW